MAATIRENVAALPGANVGCDLITITAPGADQLPWDTAQCRHMPGVPCSGTRGCVIHPAALAAWHRTSSDRLNALWRSAREKLRRKGYRLPEYVLVPEPQKRGALHFHIATGVHQRNVAYALYEALEARAEAYGFGSLVGWDPCRGQARNALALYVSKLAGYVSKSAGEGGALLEVVQALPRRRIVRAALPTTARTRATMRNARMRRFLFRKGFDGLTLAGAETIGPEWERWAPLPDHVARRLRADLPPPAAA